MARLEQIWKEGIEKDTIIVVQVLNRGNYKKMSSEKMAGPLPQKHP